MTENTKILETCLNLKDEMTAFLDKLLRFESVSSHEGPVMDWLYSEFKELADDCELIAVPESIVKDPDYSFRLDDMPYKGRRNLRVVLKGTGEKGNIIINAHSDVVPPSAGQERPFDPFIKDGAIFARGACDDKGQIAVMWTILKAFGKLGIRPKGDLIFHIVLEEETGGNGTLALIRRGEKADCCINLEPCSNNILTSVRGAVWFTGTVYGRAGHSGSAGTTVSALKMAVEAMKIIEEYHDELLSKTINDDPLFAKLENPMPVTFGELHAGDWPAMAPRKAVFKGVFGLLTTSKEEVMHGMTERVKTRGPEWLKDNFEMSFQYRHDTSRVNPETPFVKSLAECYKTMGIKSEISAMPASSDAWFYTNILGIPTVATGCGHITDAHTASENVVLREILEEAAALTLFVMK